jgi:prolyl oligopeptidase
VLVDPAQRGTGDSTAVGIVAISDDGRLLAYSVRQGGTDHCALEILDVENGIVLPDGLPGGFCTGFVFAGDGSGFYYSHRELHDHRPNYRAVYWHGLGLDRSRDEEMFLAGEQLNLLVGVLHSAEANVLAYPVYSIGKLRRTSLYLQKPVHGSGRPVCLLQDIEGCFIPFFAQNRLLAYTDFAAPNFRIVDIDIESPNPAYWHDVVPETSRRIQQFAVAGDQIFVTRVNCFTTDLEVFRLRSGNESETVVSSHGSINLLNSTVKSNKLFYGQTSIDQPASIHCYDTRQKQLFTCEERDVPFEGSEIEVEEVMYPSRDHLMVPLLLAARRDRINSRPLPTFLSGYGGFGTCVAPRFTAFATFLMDQGFLFAVPALRGGSELGEQWHRAAMRGKRQNSYDDFTAAAEWLIAEGRAVPDRIAIGGGSNAGLLVGVAITQRPDLFRAAICLGPLLDMARYHLFDFAAGWTDEYGSPDDEQDCEMLLNYSPYHGVRNGIAYPAVLLISGDADTRCNPMHARKMTARLQAATASEYPVLLDYRSTWGHTPVQPLSRRVEALADRLAFVCSELGVEVESGRV